MKLIVPFASAALFIGALAPPAYAMPVAPQKAALTDSQNADVQNVRWTGRHVRVRHYGWNRGRHYGWRRGPHYGWRHSHHRWR
jgi:hypothetical protein